MEKTQKLLVNTTPDSMPKKEQGKLTTDQVRMIQCYFMYAHEYSPNRRIAKIQWIQQPSAWEMNKASEKIDWFPFDMIRTVSAVKP